MAATACAARRRAWSGGTGPAATSIPRPSGAAWAGHLQLADGQHGFGRRRPAQPPASRRQAVRAARRSGERSSAVATSSSTLPSWALKVARRASAAANSQHETRQPGHNTLPLKAADPGPAAHSIPASSATCLTSPSQPTLVGYPLSARHDRYGAGHCHPGIVIAAFSRTSRTSTSDGSSRAKLNLNAFPPCRSSRPVGQRNHQVPRAYRLEHPPAGGAALKQIPEDHPAAASPITATAVPRPSGGVAAQTRPSAPSRDEAPPCIQ